MRACYAFYSENDLCSLLVLRGRVFLLMLPPNVVMCGYKRLCFMYLSYVSFPFSCIYDLLFAVDYLFKYAYMFVFGRSPRTALRQGKNEGSIPVVYVGHSCTGTDFLGGLRCSSVSIILPVLHDHISFICHRRCVISPSGSIVN